MRKIHKHIHRIRKQTLDLLKQEIFAVIAVAVFCLVLVVWYNSTQTDASAPEARQVASISTPQTGVVTRWWDYVTEFLPNSEKEEIAGELHTSTLGTPLRGGKSTILFGSEIKGLNRSGIESWLTVDGIKNHGTHLEMLEDNEVTLSNLHNGQFDLWIEGVGRMTINEIGVNIWTINTIKRTINIPDGTLSISFEQDTKIYSISTLAPEGDIPVLPELTQTPQKISIFPSMSTINLQKHTPTIFKPVAIVTDTTGKQIPNTSGLINWESSDSSIASVASTGLVTVNKAGVVTITATITGTEISNTAVLTVQSIVDSPLVDLTPKEPIEVAAVEIKEAKDVWKVKTGFTGWLFNLFN
ncbi:MAG: Ig-like domain-containing protein [Patescibacteria group bacterium]|nr:Ig-like domain-containing protein [Patescibacteria group bacterium]